MRGAPRGRDRVARGANETADIHLKGRDDVLPVSRNYLHLFRQMTTGTAPSGTVSSSLARVTQQKQVL
jgi:hypothetical protein